MSQSPDILLGNPYPTKSSEGIDMQLILDFAPKGIPPVKRKRSRGTSYPKFGRLRGFEPIHLIRRARTGEDSCTYVPCVLLITAMLELAIFDSLPTRPITTAYSEEDREDAREWLFCNDRESDWSQGISYLTCCELIGVDSKKLRDLILDSPAFQD